MKPPFVRSAYNYDMNKAGDEDSIMCMDPSRTQQHFRDEVDINTLVERFKLTGEMPQLEQLPSFQDFQGIFDYQTAMNAVVAARETFQSLPAKLRARFHNQPQEFIEFFDDPENRPEAEKLGLVDKPAPKPAESSSTDPDKPKPATEVKPPEPKK